MRVRFLNCLQGLVVLPCFLLLPDACGVTLRTNTQAIAIVNPSLIPYAAGFSYQTQTGDLAVDSRGNAHLASGCQAGHIGNAEVRRWDLAITNWGGAKVVFTNGDGYCDVRSVYIAVDEADRVHLLYQHRTATNTASDPTTPYRWYHWWCTNASGSTPLGRANWQLEDSVTNIALGAHSGWLMSLQTNTLLFAQGRMDANGDGYWDIRIDRANWDGSGWNWTPVGLALPNVRTDGWGNTYGGLHSPRLMADSNHNLLHMAFYDGSWDGSRGVKHAVSTNPFFPASNTWTKTSLTDPNPPNFKETQGGLGVTDDGTGVALIWACPNRDNITTETNYMRLRDVSSGWGTWTYTFNNDVRRLPSSYDRDHATVCISDGAGGLFASYDGATISHWDPKSKEWADAFTNRSTTASGPKGNLCVNTAPYPKHSTLYHFHRGIMSLYVGQYLIGGPRGTVILLR